MNMLNVLFCIEEGSDAVLGASVEAKDFPIFAVIAFRKPTVLLDEGPAFSALPRPARV